MSFLPSPPSVIRLPAPRGLLSRFVLILVIPFVILQIVTTQVFYDRHWDTVLRRLASSLAGDIALVADLIKNAPTPQHQANISNLAQTRLLLKADFRPGEILPNNRIKPSTEQSVHVLLKHLKEQFQRPILVEASPLSGDIHIAVQFSDGVLHVLAPRKRLFSSTTYIFILWMVGTSLVLLGIAILFMSNQIRSIRRLADSAEKFGKGHDLPPIKPEGAREVRQAGHAFNSMRKRIRRQIDQRTDMLAGVSHDLRTPLTRMRLQLAMMGDSQDVIDLTDDITEMERMLDGYLDFARGEGTETTLSVDLVNLLKGLIKRFQRQGTLIKYAPITGLHDQTESYVMVVRKTGLERALGNLLSNAARHGHQIQIGLSLDADHVEIYVEDDGPGIPEPLRKHVFRPFWRQDPSRNSKTGGVGLGLSIARDVAHAHGGRITLETSAALGGLKATLHLPR